MNKKEKNMKSTVILNLIQDPYNVKPHQNGFRIRSGMTQYECGRSMVEMLGVLAVMGVLSVGGVAMYTNAMNKYRANEILNEASKRAVMVAGQLLTNPNAENMSLSQFGSNTVAGATFKNDATISNGKIILTVSAVESAVCTQMKAATGDNAAMSVDDNCTKLTFNTDMSTGDISFGESESSIDTGTCSNGNVYLSYNVGAECDTTTPQNMECTKNSDCGSGAYCKLTGDWQNSCPVTGSTCETLDKGTETTYENGTNKKMFLVSSGCMSWWAAENWCKAHHMDLVSYSTLNSLFNCSKDKGGCTFSRFTTNSYWSNGTLPNDYWTAENSNSCDAWFIRTAFGDFSTSPRYSLNYSALCE